MMTLLLKLHQTAPRLKNSLILILKCFIGSTTIVLQVSILDFTQLFSNPQLNSIYRYLQGGSIAVYKLYDMIALHQSLADE